MSSPRLAARAIILHESRLLLVNAWANPKSDLWCAPGGGVERGASLPDNLAREVLEETGLTVSVGAPCLINEFHDPGKRFHQVEVFFRCTITDGVLDERWKDPEGVVTKRRLVTQDELQELRVKPSSLAQVAWSDTSDIRYDPLEPILR